MLELSAGETLKYGSRNDKVKVLQTMLAQIAGTHNRTDFHPGAIDGIFGTRTQSAVVNFQTAIGIVPDGAVGPVTTSAINAVAASPAGTVNFGVPVSTGLAPTTAAILPAPVTPQIPITLKTIGFVAAIAIGFAYFWWGSKKD